MKSLVISNKITNINETSFKQYLAEVAKKQLLTQEEESYYAHRASNNDTEAINKLIECNLRFVISVAKQYVNQNNTIEDLVNEGNIGLIMAIRRFKPNTGVKFISYAVWWIRKHILDYIYGDGKMIHLPANRLNELSKLEKEMSSIEQINCGPVDAFELIDDSIETINPSIIDDFGLEDGEDDPVKAKYVKISRINTLSSFTIDSLDREMTSYDDSMTLLDVIQDESCAETDHLVSESKATDTLKSALNSFSVENKQLLTLLFGLDGNPERTLKEVGEELNISREAVRVLKNKLLIQLKRKIINLNNKGN